MNRELILVGVGLLAMTIHSADETLAFGAPSGPPWIAQIAVILVLIALSATHRRLGRWRLVPAALTFGLGLFVVGTGWSAHVRTLLQQGPGPTDGTGVLFLLGGIVLMIAGVLLFQQTVRAWRRAPARRLVKTCAAPNV